MSYSIDQRIQKAARELQDALNDGDRAGKSYIGSIRVGRHESAEGPVYRYVVRVSEYTEREVAA